MNYFISEYPPAGFFETKMRSDVWWRVAMAVQIMAETCRSTYQDISVSLAEELESKPGNFWTLLAAHLPRYGLAITDAVQTIGPSKLGLIRLTDKGKRLASKLGVSSIGESDWERVLRLRPSERRRGHTALLLHYDLSVRRMGYQTCLLPEVPSGKGFKPDIQVTIYDPAFGLQNIFVCVEGRWHHSKLNKWLKMADRQGYVAVCAKTPASRQALVRECQSIDVAGVAVDLPTLIKNYHAGKIGPLWQEFWPGHFNDPRQAIEFSHLIVCPILW